MTSEPRTKVIFDTNIWISYLIGHQLGELTELLTSQKIEIILSEQLRTELTEVTRRKKFQEYFSKEKVTELLKLMDFIGTDYEVLEYPKICRDPKDNFLLGLIRASKANFLVTGDQDLLELHPFEGTEIIEPNQLLKKIAGR
ncbi:putative toxin-antitoxin system toxin component, PIN family [Ekhidna sp. MALMAid0563]|uniref:putative toxin-antitoxin system toxin component, PIN family n=1 Tax=Ekhidna sp. MALMAid0563 TaxID=3143937 RepID=UPI0032DF075D